MQTAGLIVWSPAVIGDRVVHMTMGALLVLIYFGANGQIAMSTVPLDDPAQCEKYASNSSKAEWKTVDGDVKGGDVKKGTFVMKCVSPMK